MKNHNLSLKFSLFLFIAFVAIGCQKNSYPFTGMPNTGMPNALVPVQTPVLDAQSAINQWYAEKLKTANDNAKDQLGYLYSKLLTLAAEVKATNDGKRQVVIVPVSDDFVSKSNSGLQVTNTLVLVLENNKRIFDYVMQFLPKDTTQKVRPKPEVFTTFFNDKTPLPYNVPDGKYRMVLTDKDRPLGGFTYEGNQSIAFSNVQQKPRNTPFRTACSGIEVNAFGCTDYYWVTTYADGSEYWDFLYTTCPDCSGGGGDSPDNNTISVSALKQWLVIQGTATNWAVRCSDVFYGEKTITPYSLVFTSISHSNFQSTNCDFLYPAWNSTFTNSPAKHAKTQASGVVHFSIVSGVGDVNVPVQTVPWDVTGMGW